MCDVQFHAFMLSELRVARQRARLLVNEIERIGVALKGHMISSEVAVEWLNDAWALNFLTENGEPEMVDAVDKFKDQENQP